MSVVSLTCWAEQVGPMDSPRRLPMPDWSRPGETWRVEPEPYIEVCDAGFICGDGRGCSLPAVALVGRGRKRPICEYHMSRDAMAWIEDGQVVSWRLSL